MMDREGVFLGIANDRKRRTFLKIVRHNGAKFWYNTLRQKESNTMSLTLTAAPEIIDGARSYAARSGMTLEAFVLAYLKTAARRERKRCEPSRPAWAGLCEGVITRNFFGPHDMSSIRESITSAEGEVKMRMRKDCKPCQAR